MKDHEYKLLEDLLGKLSIELGAKDFCITNGVVQDGYHIGVYNKERRTLEKQAISYDLKSCVAELSVTHKIIKS